MSTPITTFFKSTSSAKKPGSSSSSGAGAGSGSSEPAAGADEALPAPSPAVQSLLARADASIGCSGVHTSWLPLLHREASKPYFASLVSFVEEEREKNTVFPAPENVLSLLRLCPLDSVRVVILGQDPYHGPGQAHGLSFSVLPGVRQPPSLRNMLKEATSDVGTSAVSHGYLLPWAKQGVFMLNAVLTVRKKSANSHKKRGWEHFTDAIIQEINRKRSDVVFLLWGKPAQAKRSMISSTKHHVLTAVHPSPLSASRGFFGCKHYSKANAFLESRGHEPIDWSLPEVAPTEE